MEGWCFVSGSEEEDEEPGELVCTELELQDEGLSDEEEEGGGFFFFPKRRNWTA